MTPRRFRYTFPSMVHTIHVASCSFTPPSSELATSSESLLAQLGSGAPPWHFYESQLDVARQRFGRIVGSSPDHVAIMPNASVGAFQAASTVDWTQRRRIVASVTEFPSLAYVWRRLAPDLRLVDAAPDGGISVEHYLDAIDADTGLVSIPLVSFRNGARAELDELAAITARAHEVGARVLVDAYQAVGVVPCQVDELACDFLVAGAMKYLLGLPGVAYLYARDPARGQDPLLTGWFGQSDPFAFDPHANVHPDQARRFETGTPPFPAVHAANVGMDQVAALSEDEVWRHVSQLVAYAGTELAGTEVGGVELAIASPESAQRRGPMVALDAGDPAHATAVAQRLADEAIVASPRGEIVRLAFHYFNTEDDVDAITAALKG